MLCRLSRLGISSRRRWCIRRSRGRFEEKNRVEGEGREEEMGKVGKRDWMVVGVRGERGL